MESCSKDANSKEIIICRKKSPKGLLGLIGSSGFIISAWVDPRLPSSFFRTTEILSHVREMEQGEHFNF